MANEKAPVSLSNVLCLLGVVVIPLIIWGNDVNSTNKVQDIQIANCFQTMEQNKQEVNAKQIEFTTDIKEVKAILTKILIELQNKANR